MTKKQAKRPQRRSPRLQVTLTAEGMAMLERISAATGEKKSTLLSELLEMGMPALEQTIQAIELVRTQPREAQRLMTNFGANAIQQLTQAQLDLDVSVGKALDGRTVKGKRARRASGPT